MRIGKRPCARRGLGRGAKKILFYREGAAGRSDMQFLKKTGSPLSV